VRNVTADVEGIGFSHHLGVRDGDMAVDRHVLPGSFSLYRYVVQHAQAFLPRPCMFNVHGLSVSHRLVHLTLDQIQYRLRSMLGDSALCHHFIIAAISCRNGLTPC